MDPARPADPDPADPFFPERADHAILETIEIATKGEDCDECVRKLRPVLKNITGVQDVKSRSPERARDRHFRPAQNACARSARGNLEERLQTGAGGRLRMWERPRCRDSRDTKVPPTFTQPVAAASGSGTSPGPR